MKLKSKDLSELRDLAHTAYMNLPARVCLDRTEGYLPPDQISWLATLDACLTFLHTRGILKPEFAEPIELYDTNTISVFKDDL